MNTTLSNTNKTNGTITTGVVWQQLLKFFFPILFGIFFQQLYNTVDAIIVGKYLGKEVLAAVGGGSGTIVNLLIGFFTGVSSGATVIISQFYGAKKNRAVKKAVHTAIALALVGGAIITALGVVCSPVLLRLMRTPENIFVPANTYLRIFFGGIIPAVMYNMGSGILRAVGDSRRPFYILVAGTLANIVLDILFIAVFGWGVSGAAYATVVAETFTMILVALCLMRTRDCFRVSLQYIRFDTVILRRIIQIGIPAGIQSIMYTISNLIIQTYINGFGTNVIAAWAAFGKLDAFYWMTINSLGIAATTFAGQNFGAGRIDRVRKGMHQSFVIGLILTLSISAVFLIFGASIYTWFTDDPGVIKEGMRILYVFVPSLITYIAIEILSGTIRGCGYSLVPMILTCGGVCVLRIIWLAIAIPVNPVIETVCLAYPISWVITSVLFAIYYNILQRRNFMPRELRYSHPKNTFN